MTVDVTPALDASPRDLAQTSADDPGHLVCCRDPAWLGGPLKALCGYEEDGSAVGLEAEHVCQDCIAEAERLRPGFRLEPGHICPYDGKPCPDDLALLDLISKRVLPD